MKTKINKYILIILLPIFINNCGTIYNPQVLNQARGISFSEGQEQLIIDVVPLTSKADSLLFMVVADPLLVIIALYVI